MASNTTNVWWWWSFNSNHRRRAHKRHEVGHSKRAPNRPWISSTALDRFSLDSWRTCLFWGLRPHFDPETLREEVQYYSTYDFSLEKSSYWWSATCVWFRESRLLMARVPTDWFKLGRVEALMWSQSTSWDSISSENACPRTRNPSFTFSTLHILCEHHLDKRPTTFDVYLQYWKRRSCILALQPANSCSEAKKVHSWGRKITAGPIVYWLWRKLFLCSSWTKWVCKVFVRE